MNCATERGWRHRYLHGDGENMRGGERGTHFCIIIIIGSIMKVLNKKGENHEKNSIDTFIKFGFGNRYIGTVICRKKDL
jgi:hypothetical protein